MSTVGTRELPVQHFRRVLLLTFAAMRHMGEPGVFSLAMIKFRLLWA